MLKKVKLKNFFACIIVWWNGFCWKYAVQHKNFAREKICIYQKVVVTLHSLSGSNGSQACKGRKPKDIEKAYNRQEVVQENERASAKEFLVNSKEA